MAASIFNGHGLLAGVPGNMSRLINKPSLLAPGVIEKLPSFQSVEYLPQRFDDSTHNLWRLKARQSNLFLKVCNNTGSPFWQVMRHLFAFDLSKEIESFSHLYQFITSATPLQIPTLITAESAVNDQEPAFILTSELSGNVVDNVNPQMVEQLAKHLAQLHHKEHNSWGTIVNPAFDIQQWPQRLEQTLSHFAREQNTPNDITTQALNACKHATSSSFIPMMPDLRWDQFLQQDNRLTALVDLDAFILAPRELDFVLLEFILTPEQHAHFVQAYTRILPVPEITLVRPAYRLLLYFMQVLGEQELSDWMEAEQRF